MDKLKEKNTDFSLKNLFYFLGLILVSIGINYYSPGIFSSIFFIVILIAYFYSEEEAFWLAFFLVLTDGFFGFFGRYEASISAIPGLPEVEVAQFYVVLSIVKAMQKKKATYRPFYSGFLIVFLVYVVFLILQGFLLGISPKLNVYFRIIKIILPFFLLYSLPKLMDKEKDYRNLFAYLFPVAIVALATQVFTILMVQTPLDYFGATAKIAFKYAREVTETFTYRGIFNTNIIFITTIGALYYLVPGKRQFRISYLTLILAVNFFSIFLSATRGLTATFLIMLFLYLLFVVRVNAKNMLASILVGIVLVAGIASIPTLRLQLKNASDRILTIQKVIEGDLSAGGTLSRFTERGPAVMEKWAESPLTGWGYSDYFFRYNDEHVGNQNLLFHGGILGALLMAAFFAFFVIKFLLRSINLPPGDSARKGLFVFVIGLFGWFVLHSVTVQQFGFWTYAAEGIIQCVFFSFAALVYHNAQPQVDTSPEVTGEKVEKAYSTLTGN